MKNKTMRLASALLVLVMLTTCVISGTFAKYVTEATGMDSAHVAYWGFTDPGEVEVNLFQKHYYSGSTVTVESGNNNGKLIAPGTENETQIVLKYTEGDFAEAPEVAYKFEIEVNDSDDFSGYDGTNEEDMSTLVSYLDANKNFVWTLNGETYDTVAELFAAIKALSGDASGTKQYQPRELPEFCQGELWNVNNVPGFKIGWEWKFEDATNTNTYPVVDNGDGTYSIADDGDESVINLTQDEFDTYMGNYLATEEDFYLNIRFTATQVD